MGSLKIDDHAGNTWEFSGGYFKEALNAGDPSYEYGNVIVGLGGMMVVTLGREVIVKPMTAQDFRPVAIELITREAGRGRMIWGDGRFSWVTGVEFVSESNGPDGCVIHRFRALLKPG